MAEAAETNGRNHTTDLKTLKAQITCKVCQSQYRSPKTLPCLHSFCLACLKKISTTSDSCTRVQCPECSKVIQIQSTDFSDAPDAFQLNRRIELYTFLMKVNGKLEAKCEKCSNKSVRATSFCPECSKFICDLCVTIHRSWSEFSSHAVISLVALRGSYKKHIPEKVDQVSCMIHSKECTFYCESCEELICHECIVKGHRDHQYHLAAESASNHKARMKNKLEQVHDIPDQLEQAIAKANEICDDFSGEGEMVAHEINAQFDELEAVIATRRKALLEEIHGMVESKVKLLSDQRTGFESVKAKVTTCIDFVMQTVASEHISEFFVLESKMASRIAEVNNEFTRLDLVPVEDPEAHFSFPEELARNLETAGSVSEGSFLYAGTSSSKAFVVNEVVTFYIALSSAYYKTKANPMKEIKAEILSLRDGSVCPASIAVSGSGFAKLQCSFSERGRYAISITVEGRHIGGSPRTFYVQPPSTQFQVPVKTIGKLNSPKGLAVNGKNQIVVSEENRHALSIYNKKGKKVLSFGSFGSDDAQFSHPMGVAVDQSECIYVADTKNNRIQKFDSDGNLLASFTGEKTPAGCLHGPTGVKLNKEDNLFIVDRGNSRIVVLNTSLEFQYEFGSPGSELGQLADPWDIAFDDEGLSYVTDTKQHCIQIFTQTGSFRGKISSHGTQKSRLNRPSGIAVDRFGKIYVCEFGNHRVSIFHICSEFLDCFSTGLSMVNPCAIAVDNDGFVYVSSAENLHVF